MREHHQPTTIAILGADTVVGRALSALLGSSGYDIRPLDAYPTGVVDDLLDGADLLLLAPRLDLGVREAFLSAMGRSTSQNAGMPVISLSTTTMKEDLPEEKVLSVPWPCAMEDLLNEIAGALYQQRSVFDERKRRVI